MSCIWIFDNHDFLEGFENLSWFLPKLKNQENISQKAKSQLQNLEGRIYKNRCGLWSSVFNLNIHVGIKNFVAKL